MEWSGSWSGELTFVSLLLFRNCRLECECAPFPFSVVGGTIRSGGWMDWVARREESEGGDGDFDASTFERTNDEL